MSNPILKLKLYLESAQVAVMNQCLSQSDAFLKAALNLIPDIQKQIELSNAAHISASSLNFDGSARPSTITSSVVEKFLSDYLLNMMSTLLIIPDNPDQGVLYLSTGVLNIITKHFSWENLDIKLNLLLNLITLLSALKQENYLFNIENLELNDTLYGSDIKYIREVNKTIETVMEEIINLFEKLVSSFFKFLIFLIYFFKYANIFKNPQKKSQFGVDFLNRIISHADLNDSETQRLVEYLWDLSKSQPKTKLQV